MNKKVLTIIITILVIAGLVAGAVFFLGKKDKNTSEKPAETTTEKVTEEVTEDTTEDATEDVTEEDETDEEETDEVPGETETKAPAEGMEIGSVLTYDILYGDKLDELVYEYQMEPRNYKEHLEYTKEISSDIATKYRSEYVKDLENIPFDASYIVDEDSKKYFTDKPVDELKALVYGAGEVAQKFATVYFTNDSNGPVYGYPSWDYSKYIYKNRVTVDHIKSVDTLFILCMKMNSVDLKVSADGTVQAYAYFIGYGVDCNDDNECHDMMFGTMIKLVYDDIKDIWCIWDTVESYEGFENSIVPTVVNEKPQMLSLRDSKEKKENFKAIIGTGDKVFTSVDRK